MTISGTYSRNVATEIREEALRRGQSGYYDRLSGDVYRFVGGGVSDFYLEIHPINVEDGVRIIFTDGKDIRERVFEEYPELDEYREDLEWWLKMREEDELESVDWLWRSGSNIVTKEEYYHLRNLQVIRRDLDRYYKWADLSESINGIDKTDKKFHSAEYYSSYRSYLTLWDKDTVDRYIKLLDVLADGGVPGDAA